MYLAALADASVEQGVTASKRAHLRDMLDERLGVAVPGDVAVEKLCQAGVPCIVAGGLVLHFARIGQQPTFFDLAMAMRQVGHVAAISDDEYAQFAQRMDAAAHAFLDAELADESDKSQLQ